MSNWEECVNKIKQLLKSNDLIIAKKEIAKYLEKMPNQLNLLVIATNVYRASGERDKSLEYSNLLIKHHPGDWNGYGRAAQDLIALKRINQAQKQIQVGLQKLPNQLNLLTIATEIFRASGDRIKSLEYSELLIKHHPGNWNGYGRAAQDLIALKQSNQAQKQIQLGLQKLPNQLNLLTIATEIFRASGDREKSLEYSELLITHHPGNWNGYGRSAQDLVALKRCNQAQKQIQLGLEKLPNQFNLLIIATEIFRASGDREKSLEYSKLLIAYHPDKWNGYLRAAQDKLSLGRFHPDEYHKQMIRCKPPRLGGELKFWNNICNYRNSSLQDSWYNSFKINSQPTYGEQMILANQWQPFQYWSQGDPPDAIKEITKIWNSIFVAVGVRPIVLFDRNTALKYIEKHCPELAIAFTTAFHYAVEADVFRVAYAQKNNCIWLDSDLYPNRNTIDFLKILLPYRKTTLFFRWFQPWITNAFFIAPASSLFFANILSSTANTNFSNLPHTVETVGSTFGPTRFNQEIKRIFNLDGHNDEESLIAGYKNAKHFNFVNEHTFANMAPPFKLEYKSSNDNWQNALRA